jgi:hypothetical protein
MCLRGVLALDGDEPGAAGGHRVQTLRQPAAAPQLRLMGAYAGIRRHVQKSSLAKPPSGWRGRVPYCPARAS